MKTGNSDVARSDLDRKTIALIESIAKQVRTSIASRNAARHRTAGPQS